MEWQQVLGFYHVVRFGSFTKAADATFRTQSALSQQIKSLEDELDCRLIERVGKRRLQLTSAGERFFKFSESIIEEYGRLTEDLDEIKGFPKGRLKTAAPFTTLYHLFPEVVRRYVRDYPHVELTILDRPQEAVISLARNGDIDFGFGLESEIPKDLAAVRWKKVETVVMVPKGHQLTETKELSFDRIARFPLILPPKSLKRTFRNRLEQGFRKCGVDYRIVMESSNVELSSLYVEMGLGISFATIIKDLPALKDRGLEFLRMEIFEPDYIALIMRKDKKLAEYKKGFIRMLIGGSIPE